MKNITKRSINKDNSFSILKHKPLNQINESKQLKNTPVLKASRTPKPQRQKINFQETKKDKVAKEIPLFEDDATAIEQVLASLETSTSNSVCNKSEKKDTENEYINKEFALIKEQQEKDRKLFDQLVKSQKQKILQLEEQIIEL